MAKAIRKRVGLKDIAAAVDVHVSTVSRALDPKSKHLINSDLVATILKKSHEMGYKPNLAAYSLKTSKTYSVGVIIPDITNSIFPPIIRGIEDVMLKSGYTVILGNTDGEPERERALIDIFLSRGVDGLIVASAEHTDPILETPLDEEIPIVTVNRLMQDKRASSVVPDDADGIRRAIVHLLSLGHRSIAHVAGPQTMSTGIRRHQAFKDALAEFQLDGNPKLTVFSSKYTENEGEKCLDELVASGVDFTAVVCANDRLALGVITGLQRIGLRCPEDISVTGYNDMPLMDRVSPALTTVHVRQYEMGARAGSILLNKIEFDGPPMAVVEPVELRVRASTCPPRNRS